MVREGSAVDQRPVHLYQGIGTITASMALSMPRPHICRRPATMPDTLRFPGMSVLKACQ